MDQLEILVVGNGGREHAIVLALSGSKIVSALHCTPGNAGTNDLATNHNVSASDIEGIVSLSKELDVSMVVVGPESPLVDGLADRLRKEGIPCFGPHSEGAMLEGSKLHAKQIMEQLGIPTGKFKIITDQSSINDSLDEFSPPWVIKRDVLAGGKGVTVSSSMKEAQDAIKTAIELDKFVLLEEYLEGEEASILVMMDESGYVMLPPSQDHKRALDGDLGPNTGGMGAYAPAPIASPSVIARTRKEIVEPMHHHLRNSTTPYRGCLYVGLMIDQDGSPRVVEFNVRLGDPEAQVTIPLIRTDFAEVLMATALGNLATIEVDFSNKHASTVVLASEGYPGEVISGRYVSGWDIKIEEGEVLGLCHIAGAETSDDGRLISTGGRVLSATGVAPSLAEALEASYQIVEGVQLQGSHYRKDIGSGGL